MFDAVCAAILVTLAVVSIPVFTAWLVVSRMSFAALTPNWFTSLATGSITFVPTYFAADLTPLKVEEAACLTPCHILLKKPLPVSFPRPFPINSGLVFFKCFSAALMIFFAVAFL